MFDPVLRDLNEYLKEQDHYELLDSACDAKEDELWEESAYVISCKLWPLSIRHRDAKNAYAALRSAIKEAATVLVKHEERQP